MSYVMTLISILLILLIFCMSCYTEKFKDGRLRPHLTNNNYSDSYTHTLDDNYIYNFYKKKYGCKVDVFGNKNPNAVVSSQNYKKINNFDIENNKKFTDAQINSWPGVNTGIWVRNGKYKINMEKKYGLLYCDKICNASDDCKGYIWNPDNDDGTGSGYCEWSKTKLTDTTKIDSPYTEFYEKVYTKALPAFGGSCLHESSEQNKGWDNNTIQYCSDEQLQEPNHWCNNLYNKYNLHKWSSIHTGGRFIDEESGLYNSPENNYGCRTSNDEKCLSEHGYERTVYDASSDPRIKTNYTLSVNDKIIKKCDVDKLNNINNWCYSYKNYNSLTDKTDMKLLGNKKITGVPLFKPGISSTLKPGIERLENSNNCVIYGTNNTEDELDNLCITNPGCVGYHTYEDNGKKKACYFDRITKTENKSNYTSKYKITDDITKLIRPDYVWTDNSSCYSTNPDYMLTIPPVDLLKTGHTNYPIPNKSCVKKNSSPRENIIKSSYYCNSNDDCAGFGTDPTNSDAMCFYKNISTKFENKNYQCFEKSVDNILQNQNWKVLPGYVTQTDKHSEYPTVFNNFISDNDIYPNKVGDRKENEYKTNARDGNRQKILRRALSTCRDNPNECSHITFNNTDNSQLKFYFNKKNNNNITTLNPNKGYNYTTFILNSNIIKN